jgi:hypothetical protein
MCVENIGRPRVYKVLKAKAFKFGFECLWRFKIQAMGYQPPHLGITPSGNVFSNWIFFFLVKF